MLGGTPAVKGIICKRFLSFQEASSFTMSPRRTWEVRLCTRLYPGNIGGAALHLDLRNRFSKRRLSFQKPVRMSEGGHFSSHISPYGGWIAWRAWLRLVGAQICSIGCLQESNRCGRLNQKHQPITKAIPLSNVIPYFPNLRTFTASSSFLPLPPSSLPSSKTTM